jgi:hypothetical protein
MRREESGHSFNVLVATNELRGLHRKVVSVLIERAQSGEGADANLEDVLRPRQVLEAVFAQVDELHGMDPTDKKLTRER